MHVKVLSEYGYNEALFGLGLSHGVTSDMVFDAKDDDPILSFILDAPSRKRMQGVANKLAGKSMGHDKFLRQICVWLDITAPRYFWPEMDQYKVATVTQSESTMYTIHKKEFTMDDFELEKVLAFKPTIDHLNQLRAMYIDTKEKTYWRMLIQLLPQSYLQRRILTCNYATLRNIIDQRTGHRLSEWATFIDAIKSQCEHPELLP